jgi:cystathionine beta-synthase
VAPHVEFVLADPVGSILAEYADRPCVRDQRLLGGGRHRRRLHPRHRRHDAVTQAYTISDPKASPPRGAAQGRRHPGGSSTGTLLAAALRYCREQTTPKRVVTLSATPARATCRRSTTTAGCATRACWSARAYGDLRDLIGRRFDAGEVISVGPDDTLMIAFNRMRAADGAAAAVERPAGRHHRRIGLLLSVGTQPERFNNRSAPP